MGRGWGLTGRNRISVRQQFRGGSGWQFNPQSAVCRSVERFERTLHLESERVGDGHPIALERYGDRDNLGFAGRPTCDRFILTFMFFF